MPDDDTSASGPDLTPDLTPDRVPGALRPAEAQRQAGAPFEQPSPVRFAGFIGEDDDEGRVRIYLDYELNTYVLVARGDILHRERATNTAGIDVSLVLVRKDATVVIREVSSEEIQADALSMALRAAESGVFTAAAAPGPGFTPTTPATPTIPVATAVICTRVFCTNATCTCTARHSLTCSLACTEHPLCPNPWTENWFCASGARGG
jgi:hypothetical protein